MMAGQKRFTLQSMLEEAIEAHRKNQLDHAHQLCTTIIANYPHSADAWHLLGLADMRQKQWSKAEKHIAKAIQLQPETAMFYSSMASLHWRQGTWTQAIKMAKEAIQRDPKTAEPHYTLGMVWRKQGKLPEAAAAFRQALLIQPGYASALVELGADFLERGAIDESLFFFSHALKLKPNHPQGLANYGIALHEKGDIKQAEALFRQALSEDSESSVIRLNLAALLVKQEQLDEAITHLNYVIKHQPNSADALSKLGVVFFKKGWLEKSIEMLQRALALDNTMAVTHYNLGLCYLMKGDWLRGFAAYEWRWKVDNFPSRPRSGTPWKGPEEVVERLLVYTEQGLGDAIQFVRLIPKIRRYAKTIILECAEALIPLFRSITAIDLLVSSKAPIDEYDRVIPLMSLPHILGLQSKDLNTEEIPYLSIEPDRLKQWQAHLLNLPKWRIGVVWQGNPDHRNDARRSFSLEALQPLTTLENVHLYALQRGHGLEQRAASSIGHAIHLISPDWHDFRDTAAIMMQMDLIITADTSVAHLAGAIGIPVWVAIPWIPDWRWMRDQNNSPWYPTMRLFRQSKEGDWSSVFMAMRRMLLQIVAGKIKLSSQPIKERFKDPSLTAKQSWEQHKYQARCALQKKDLATAQQLYTTLYRQLPEDIEVLEGLGQLAIHEQRMAEAIDYLERAMIQAPHRASLLNLLGMAHAESGSIARAITLFETAVHHKYKIAEYHYNLGSALKKSGELTKALAVFHRASELSPRSSEIHLNIGNIHLLEKRWKKAITAYHIALSFNPDYYTAHLNLGMAYKGAENIDKAIIHCQQAIRLQPDNPLPQINLGSVYHGKGFYCQAENCYRKALFLDSSHAMAHVNLASVYMDLRRYGEARQLLDRALALDPEYGEAHLHLSFCLLREGNLKRGWREYEWRWQTERLSMRSFRQPLWDGRLLFQQTLLVWTEQGAGDAIHFIRYLSWIRPMVQRLILLCDQSLKRLFSCLTDIDQRIQFGEPQPDFDFHIPLLSIPSRIYGICPTIPNTTPYLVPPPDAVADWSEVLENLSGLRVGIVWQGNPGHGNDLERSLPLASFAPLTQIPEVTLIALQMGPGEEQLETLYPGIDIHILPRKRHDFADTAALLMHLDLVITPDTATAHLAGALRRPCWMVLPDPSDWRWFTDIDKTVWYPSLRLFRQHKPSDWYDVIHDMAAALRAHLQDKTALIPHETNTMSDHPVRSFIHPLMQKLREGYQLFESGKIDQTTALCASLCRQFPESDAVWHLQGVLFLQTGEAKQAYYALQRAIQINPYPANYHAHLGGALMALKSMKEAEQSLLRAIQIAPKEADHHYNLGTIYKQQSDLTQANRSLSKALRYNPHHVKAWVNRGNVQLAMNQASQAIKDFQQAIKLQPDHAGAHYNLARALLFSGIWQKGFIEYAWRWKLRSFSSRLDETHLWDGKPHLDKTLLIFMEQGFGDAIQFIRYAPHTKPFFRRIIVSCHPHLHSLFQHMDQDIQWVTINEQIPSCDYVIPLLSLPQYLKLTNKTLFSTVPTPYLFIKPSTEPAYHAIWSQRLSYCHGKKIGIVWQGKSSHANDANRSFSAHHFLALKDIEDICLISLQRGGGATVNSEQLKQYGIKSWPFESDHFLETAILMQHLDLIIAADTAVAHLAGALNIPLWLLLPFHPDWRWGLNDHCRWYCNTTLFRQQKPGDWSTLFQQISIKLRNDFRRKDQSETF
ncbi:tetratricopeptide repeat protein [Magnetococcales bacterium HHB-1]